MSDLTGIVIYSDGGEDKTSGAAGWGLHGYLYNILEDKRTKFKKDKVAYGQYGYVNGNKTNKDFPVGKRIVKQGGRFTLIVNKPDSMPSEPVTPIKFYDFYGPSPGATNQLVELLAMEHALDLIADSGAKQAVVITDSDYVSKSLTQYIFQWVKNGWLTSNRDPVKNREVWESVWSKYNNLRASGVVVRIGWTYSHVGEPGNELADANATRGKIAVYNNLDGLKSIKDSKNYTEKKPLYSRLLEQRWWYGINDMLSTDFEEWPDRHVYFFGNHGKAEEEDDLIGKYTATSKLAILVTPNGEPVLDMLNQYLYDQFYDSVGLVTLGYLENITDNNRYSNLLNEKKAALYPNRRKYGITTPDGVPVLKELRPSYHGLRLHTELLSHLKILGRFLDEDEGLIVTDITDSIYYMDTSKKKHVLNTTPAIDSPNRTVRLEVAYKCGKNEGKRIVPFKMGQDIPLRNSLKGIITQYDNIRVYAVTWQRSRNEFQYGTIVEADDDLLLTCALSSNLVPIIGVK